MTGASGGIGSRSRGRWPRRVRLAYRVDTEKLGSFAMVAAARMSRFCVFRRRRGDAMVPSGRGDWSLDILVKHAGSLAKSRNAMTDEEWADVLRQSRAAFRLAAA